MYVLEEVNSKQPQSIVRTCGKNEYEIEYINLNGDMYEKCLIKSMTQADESAAKLTLLRDLRQAMLKKVAGVEYSDDVTRKWPVWLMADVNDFIWGYIQGNV